MRVHLLVSTSSRAFVHTQIQYKDVNPKNAIGIIAILSISNNAHSVILRNKIKS